jgi:uncharacterized membrane protein YkoI
MNRRMTITALAAFALTGLGLLAVPAAARDCAGPCASTVQHRGTPESERPFLRGPAGERYGSRLNERTRIPQTREPLSDSQIWAIAKSRVPGRIVSARLHGSAYSFRIISNRGSIVDVVVDRYTGRVLSVRGGP